MLQAIEEEGFKSCDSEELSIENVDNSGSLKVEPKISLNAIIGTSKPNTIRIKGKIIGEDVVILIDFGSTHNFLDPLVVRKYKDIIDRSNIIKVKVANRQVLTSEGFFQTEVKIQGITSCPKFHTLSMGGCDVV